MTVGQPLAGTGVPQNLAKGPHIFFVCKKLRDVSGTVKYVRFGRCSEAVHRPDKAGVARHCKQRRQLDWRQCLVAMNPASEVDASGGHLLSAFGLKHQRGRLRYTRVDYSHLIPRIYSLISATRTTR